MTTTSLRVLCVCLCALLWSTLTSRGSAQGRFNIETFEPAPDVNGSVLNVYGARTLAPRSYQASLVGSYARKPLSVESPNGEHLGDLVGSITTFQLLGVVAVHERIDIALGIPFHRVSAGSDFRLAPPPAVVAAALSDTELALGDIRVVPRVSLYKQASERGIAVALLAPTWLPTGRDAAYAGEPFRIEPRLALDYHSSRLLVAFNAGYLVRSAAEVLGSEVDDQLRMGVGTDVGLVGGLSLLAEVDAHVNVLAQDFGEDDVATEALAGLRFRKQSIIAQLGAGPGVVRGLTAPSYRMFASVTFAPSPAARAKLTLSDADADGVSDGQDRCPQQAEDHDSFEDDDGCPELDDDQDGVADATDHCPRESEDRDSVEDDDGCADVDDDRDGIADGGDRCPREAGVAAAEGCPQVPAPSPEPVVEVREQAPKDETVYFARNDDRLSPVALAQLDALANKLRAHPETEQITIEGHTDARGPEALNAQLGRTRARRVLNALVARGVDRGLLRLETYGPSRPKSDNLNEAHRAQNRRVELRIAHD